MHTSDWHIGKKTDNIDRLPEQAEILDEICEIADREGVELVIVAGDIFDTFVPSADAEELFYEKIVKLARGRAAVVIAGNHDDATRLCAAGPLAGRSGVYFSGNIYEDKNSTFAGRSCEGTELVASGEGYAVFANKRGERVYVAMLPYPTEARFKEKADGESYSDKVRFWLNKCLEANAEGLPQIIVGHLFTAGGITTESEREISLGGARAATPECFPDAAYIALGHLHRRQVVDGNRNIIYSGSILQYSFDEVKIDKSVTVFDISDGKAENIHEVLLRRGRRLAKLSAASVEDALSILPSVGDCLTELTLKLKSPLNREENALLCSKFPNIVSLKLELTGGYEYAARGRKQLSDRQLFEECYKKQYGDMPDEELVGLYLSLLEEEK